MTAANIIDTMADEQLFGAWFRGESWDVWRAVLKGTVCLPMDPAELDIFRSVAERDPPHRRVRELWASAGRRSGKDSVGSLIAAHVAAFSDCGPHLRPGERALVLVLACDRAQAKICKNYIAGYFEQSPLLRGMVTRRTADGLELSNGVDIAIGTNSFRSVRGRPILCVVMDECAFYADERSASPDVEVYRALLPGMASLPGAIMIGISSPYKKSGLLFEKFRKHFGQDDSDVLFVKGPSLTFNPTLDKRIIEDALASDPEAARAEWLGEFRNDVSNFVDPEAVAALVLTGCYEQPYREGVSYVCAIDPAGGSGGDSFSLAVAFHESGKRCLAAVREIRPPFSPAAACAELAQTIKSYGCTEAVSDRWGGQFVVEALREHGVEVRPSELTKSEWYLRLLPELNSGNVVLLDNKRLIAQLCGLERRVGRSGAKDSVDHGPSSASHDDVINSVAIALGLAAPSVALEGFDISQADLHRENPFAGAAFSNLNH